VAPADGGLDVAPRRGAWRSAWRDITPLHAVAALGAPAALLAALQWAPWVPCAFAALAAMVAIADGARHLGPIARGLAASHSER
jgi:hypothetical protein